MASSRKPKVFLCHSSGDKPAVRELYQRLQADGVEPWLDEEDLILGQRWGEEIPTAVKAADTILVCLSKSSITKEGYVQKEIGYALDAAKEKPEGTIYLIPIKLEDCPIPARLEGWHACSLSEARGYDKLIRALQLRSRALGVLEPQVQGSIKASLPQSVVPPQSARELILEALQRPRAPDAARKSVVKAHIKVASPPEPLPAPDQAALPTEIEKPCPLYG